MTNPYHPYPDAETKQHYERLESDSVYLAKHIARNRRLRLRLEKAMREDVARVRQLIRPDANA